MPRLWLRAGCDGARVDGNPLNHHLFMLLLLKAEHNKHCTFQVATVNEAKPSDEFREFNDDALTHEDDIVEALETYQPVRRPHAADSVTADLFRHFAFFIKKVDEDPQHLLAELRKIDAFLASTNTPFLTGPEPAFLDSLVLPRLHSIRIAGQALADFSIPSALSRLWDYVERGYQLEMFRRSCPSDQEIVLYWADRPDTPDISSQRRATLYRQRPSFSLTRPTAA